MNMNLNGIRIENLAWVDGEIDTVQDYLTTKLEVCLRAECNLMSTLA